MDNYTQAQYIEKFGDKMWQEKVLNTLEGETTEVESVYATDSGNIFMIMTKDEI